MVQGANEFRALAARHERESRLLLREHCPQGAVYLVGYAIECILKAKLSDQLRISRWTRYCLDHLDVNAFSHDIYRFAELAAVPPRTLRKVQNVGWHPQARYHVGKVSMADGTRRIEIAIEVVRDIEAMMGSI